MTAAGGDRIPGGRVVGKTRHGELTVDEIAELLPGLADLMDVLGRRMWTMAYAARGGNWDLARHEWRESVKLLHRMAKVRPRYGPDLAEFEREGLGPVGKALEAADLPAFEAGLRAAIASSDAFHEKWAKGYVRYRLPGRPPDLLDLGPG